MGITTDFSGDFEWVGHHRLPTGGADPRLYLFLSEEQAPTIRPKTGLSASAIDQACYIGPEDRLPRSILLGPGPVDDGSCGFWEIDRQLMPGLYGLQVPPYLRTRGYTYLYLCFSGAIPHYLEIHGIDFEPYDSVALGLSTWIRSTCHEHLTSGLRKSMPSTLRPLLQELFNQYS
jgi:hypothetical protein